ncbi:autophagy-related protein 101-like [Babylonia areolata]|uniref:autophagy-related protein 101-like n=1 Tax=Babylonia areolata TaxID=304850 RepID=UPI003FCFBEB8
MNTRTETLELDVLGGQIPEAVCSIFHTILFFRSTGKYNYKDETSYSIGTLGVVDVNCDFLDLTYARADSDDLDQYLKREVEKFSRTLRLNEASHSPHSGEIILTFYQKKKKQWPFAQECVPWEMWTLNLKVIHLPNEHERNAYRSSLGMLIGEKIMTAAEIISRDQYVPRNPNRSELENIFDSRFATVQPYLFKIDYSLQSPPPNVTGQVRQFLKHTLNL